MDKLFHIALCKGYNYMSMPRWELILFGKGGPGPQHMSDKTPPGEVILPSSYTLCLNIEWWEIDIHGCYSLVKITFNLRVQEQSSNMTSQRQYLAFTWRHSPRARINSFLSIQFNSNSSWIQDFSIQFNSYSNWIQNLSIQFQFNSFSFNFNSTQFKFYAP